MQTYTTFGGELPEPDPSIAAARVEWQQRPLDALAAILAADAVNRVEDQEDMLATVYREAIAEAGRLVKNQNAMLSPVTDAALTHARTLTATQNAILSGATVASLVPADGSAPITTTFTATDSVVVPDGVDPTTATYDFDKCMWHGIYLPNGGTYWWDGPAPIPGTKCDAAGVSLPPASPPTTTLPPIVSPPVPPTFPGIDIGISAACAVLESGTITLPKVSCLYLYVRCVSQTRADFELVDCCDTIPGRDGWLAVGPLSAQPTEADKTRAALHCITLKRSGCLSAVQTLADVIAGKNPCEEPAPVPPVPPVPPTLPPSVPTVPTTVAPIPTPDATADLWKPSASIRLPTSGPVTCDQIEWANPNVCVCMDELIRVFQDFGRWAWLESTWIHGDAKQLTDAEIEKRKAGIGISGLKLLLGKFSYSDPTLIAIAEQIIAINRAYFHKAIDESLEKAWQGVINLAKHVSGPKSDALYGLYVLKGFLAYASQYTLGYLSGQQGGPQLTTDFDKVGRVLDYAIAYLQPVELPTVAELESIWHSGEITERHAQCLVELNGHQYPITRAAWESRRAMPSVNAVVFNWLRTSRDRSTLQRELRKQGWTDPQDVNQLLASFELLPTPSDIIRMGRRDVFDPKKLGLAEMRAEWDQQIGLKELFNAQGMDVTRVQGKDGKVREYDVPFLYWASDYLEVSPTQVFEMLHRLRANRVDRLSLPGEDGKPVTPKPVGIQTVRQLLKEVDYNPIWRERLAAISYRVVGRIDVRNAYRLGAYGKPLGRRGFDLSTPGKPKPVGVAEKEVAEQSQDQGYSPVDADTQAYIAAANWEESRKLKTRTRQSRAICQAYTLGVIAEDVALKQMTEVLDDAERAKETVRLCDADAKLREVREAIAAVKSLFLSAQIDADRAKNLLRNQGVREERIAQYLRVWELRMAGRDKAITASVLCQWFGSGLIDRREFQSRLLRMGYSTENASRIIRSCELGHAAKTRKEMDRAAKLRAADLEKKRRAEERAGKEIDREAERRFTRFLATRPDKNLIAYWQDGSISIEEVRQTLLARSFTATDAVRWMSAYLKPGKGEENGQSDE